MLRNNEDAEEVSQDVFMSVYKSLPKFRGDSKVSTWMYRITYNKCLDHMKRKSGRPLAGAEDISEAFDIGAMDKNMDAMEQMERKEMVRSAISALPEDEALLITMFYLDELTLKEIASVTGDSVNTVKVRLHRSRKRLMVQLKNNMEPETLKSYERG